MKIIFLFSLGICTMVSTKARLIEKITDRTLPTETITGSSPPVRLARQTYGDYMVGVRDDIEDSNEFFTSFNRKVRHFNTGPTNRDTSRRIPRESAERTDKPAKNATKPTSTTPSTSRSKAKVALVKKPIPKYNEMDYDDDFQMKMNKSPVKLIDSGEHEDEDFNVDDYDFDVNHDEFSGRGKPLEPRMKNKGVEHAPKPEPKLPPVAPEIKIKSKVNIPHQVVSTKKERSAEKQTSKKTNEKDDYYDETSSTTKEPQKPRDLDDEFNEENEESKEFYGKLSNVRLVRSPWKTNPDKFGDKGIASVSKILSILPMFPQVPESGDIHYRVGFAPNNV